MGDQYYEDRKRKLPLLEGLGQQPYGARFEGVKSNAAIRAEIDAAGLEPGQSQEKSHARAAGRIMLRRVMGKLAFLTLRDSSGDLQIGISKSQVGDQGWEIVNLLDLGDILGVDGHLGRTKTGEPTVWAHGLTMLTKALHPPPEKWHGLHDVDMRYRQRYVDLFSNPEVMRNFQRRCRIIEAVRGFMRQQGFLEVETPMLQPIYGGAAARPFMTHHNTLDMDLYLRISPELYLKRLLVGGMERVFEINRNFRNEGISTQHNPEFTMLECYQAYGDLSDMMTLTEGMFIAAIEADGGNLQRKFGEHDLDFVAPWSRETYSGLLKKHAGVDLYDKQAIRKKAEELGIVAAMQRSPDTGDIFENYDPAVLANKIFEQTVEEHLVGPVFVTDYPAALCPLTRRRADDQTLAMRFELYVAGMELANAYTELNDPEEQRRTLSAQVEGEGADTMRVMDEDFITALEYGMPPAGGLGVGIDRVVMALTNSSSIRDVILFPLQQLEFDTLLVRELAIRELESEFGVQFTREYALTGGGVVDAFANLSNGPVAVQIKEARRGVSSKSMETYVDQISKYSNRFGQATCFILAIVIDNTNSETNNEIQDRLMAAISRAKLPAQVRIFDYRKLCKKHGSSIVQHKVEKRN